MCELWLETLRPWLQRARAVFSAFDFHLSLNTLGTWFASSPTTHHEAHSRTFELVEPTLLDLLFRLIKQNRYTNDDDSYIFAPAESVGARSLVVHRNSGDIVLDRESSMHASDGA